MMIERTDAKSARSMKNEEMFMAAFASLSGGHRRLRHAGTHGHALWRDRRSRPHALQAVHDDGLTVLETPTYDAQTLNRPSELHGAVLDFVSLAEHQHVVLRLIGADCAL